MGTKTYDQKSADLAEIFLSDEDWFHKRSAEDKKRFISELASEIQQTIESETQHYRESLHVGSGDY